MAFYSIKNNVLTGVFLPFQLNGKQKIAQMARGGNGRKQVISWMDAPDDVYFRANDNHKWVIKKKSLAL